jgi:hypothetical protein
MNVGNPLTKNKYDVGDRIIAAITGAWEGTRNHCGTVKSLTNKSYTIDYDNTNLLPTTEHNQILGLTLSTPHIKCIQDANIQDWLLQRVPPATVENIRNLLGTPLTKREYDVGDSVIAISPYRRERPAPLIDRQLRYGVVVNVLEQDRYTIDFKNKGRLPTEYHQILGLTGSYTTNSGNIQTQTLTQWLVQQIPDTCIRPDLGNPQTREMYEVGDRIIAIGEGEQWHGNFGDFGFAGTVRNLMHDIYFIQYDEGELWPTEHHQILGLTGNDEMPDKIPNHLLRRRLLQIGPGEEIIKKPEINNPINTMIKDTDTTMIKNDLARFLKKLLCNDWWIGAGSEDKAMNILSLCGYYSSEGMPQEIQSEIIKLNSQMATLRTLDKLLNAIQEGRKNEFTWNPRLEHMPNEITLSPTFNIQRGDDSILVAEVEKVRAELQKESANIATLISYISKQAKAAGDL